MSTFPTASNQPKSTVELGSMCHRVLTGPLAVTLAKYTPQKKVLHHLYFIHIFPKFLQTAWKINYVYW